jgi:ATP-dependent exoDNAse (exonuclease V) beta subunit
VHWALKDWGASQNRDEYSVDDFLKAFEWYLQEKTILTEIQKRDLLAQAKDALPLYFSTRLSDSSPILYGLERDVRAHLIDPKHPSFEPIPIKGKLDRIDLASPNSSDAIIIDYKTGRPKAPSEIRGGIEEGKVSRTAEGSYFRQMVFYALLLELAEPLLTPQVYRFEFIGERGEEPIVRDFRITQAEKDDLRKLIADVWSRIRAFDFHI